MTNVAPLPRLERHGFFNLPEYLEGAELDGRGQPLPILANALQVMRNAMLVHDAFAYDEMLRAPLLMKPLPARGTNDLGNDEDRLPRPVRDTDVTQLQEWLQRKGLQKIGKDIVHQAVDLRSQERAFHPVRDYLDALVWDGRQRLSSWLVNYLHAERSSYVEGIGAMFFVAMVARIYQPGCKADYMLVLEAAQGQRKSTACSILGGEHFSDNLPDIRDKDVAQHLRGKWLIEIAEMSAISKAEDAALKAFLTRTTERYRPPYGRKDVIEPRQCVFIGSTNRTSYLRDETGGRRYWPVKVGLADTDALARDRDQIFAEAVRLYKGGAKWWPDGEFEATHIKPQQESRFEADAWQEIILGWLAHKQQTTVGEIAKECLGFETSRIATSDRNRITAILEHLGWHRGDKDWKGRIPWLPPLDWT